jgi:hypothetical protein
MLNKMVLSGLKGMLLMSIGNESVSKDRLFALASKLFASMSQGQNANLKNIENEIMDLRFILAKALVELHGCVLHTELAEEKIHSFVILFPPSKLVF